jgi:membrane protein
MANDVRATGPDAPTDLDRRSWMATLKRTCKEFSDDNLTDRAAALTYYAVLALFPALIALVSILGLAVDRATITRVIEDTLSSIGPSSAIDTFKKPINEVTGNTGTTGVLLVLGIVTSLWSASGYIGAFFRASNAIYEREEGRPFYRLRPLQLLVTLILELMTALVVVALIISGPLATSLGNAIGIGDTAQTIFDIAKWPAMLLVVMVMLAILYYWAPNAKQPKFKWITPGSLLAVVVWIIASAAFAFYVAHFNSYNKTYGTLGGVVAFLVWLWLTNIAVLLGAELNAEVERGRELAAGVAGADEDIQLPYRKRPKDAPPRPEDDGDQGARASSRARASRTT